MAQGVYCTEYPERVSRHSGESFLDTKGAVHLTGVIRMRARSVEAPPRLVRSRVSF
jgi:hypothetical protein